VGATNRAARSVNLNLDGQATMPQALAALDRLPRSGRVRAAGVSCADDLDDFDVISDLQRQMPS
jgi:hypothetical protein